MLEQQHDDIAAKRLRAQQGNDSADDFDDEPERLRNIVAREVGRRAKLEAADRVAADLEARRAALQLEVAQAVAD